MSFKAKHLYASTLNHNFMLKERAGNWQKNGQKRFTSTDLHDITLVLSKDETKQIWIDL